MTVRQLRTMVNSIPKQRDSEDVVLWADGKFPIADLSFEQHNVPNRNRTAGISVEDIASGKKPGPMFVMATILHVKAI